MHGRPWSLSLTAPHGYRKSSNRMGSVHDVQFAARASRPAALPKDMTTRRPGSASVVVVQGRYYHELHVKAFADVMPTASGFRACCKSWIISRIWASCIWLPFFPRRFVTTVNIADYVNINPVTGRWMTSKRSSRRRTRPSGDDRARHQPHFRPAPVVQAAAMPADTRRRDYYVWATPIKSTKMRASSSPIPRSPTGRGTRSRKPISGTASSRINLTSTTARMYWKSFERNALLARHGRGWPPASMQFHIVGATAQVPRTCRRLT